MNIEKINNSLPHEFKAIVIKYNGKKGFSILDKDNFEQIKVSRNNYGLNCSYGVTFINSSGIITHGYFTSITQVNKFIFENLNNNNINLRRKTIKINN